MNKKDWDYFKKKMLKAAVAACDKGGYPINDERVCVLINDSLESTRKFLQIKLKSTTNYKKNRLTLI